jgi:hypothetical protein
MNLDALKRPLGIDEVDFRIQSINKGGYATILVYKDARADMTRLDEAVGSLGWKREHSRPNNGFLKKIQVLNLTQRQQKAWHQIALRGLASIGV